MKRKKVGVDSWRINKFSIDGIGCAQKRRENIYSKDLRQKFFLIHSEFGCQMMKISIPSTFLPDSDQSERISELEWFLKWHRVAYALNYVFLLSSDFITFLNLFVQILKIKFQKARGDFALFWNNKQIVTWACSLLIFFLCLWPIKLKSWSILMLRVMLKWILCNYFFKKLSL